MKKGNKKEAFGVYANGRGVIAHGETPEKLKNVFASTRSAVCHRLAIKEEAPDPAGRPIFKIEVPDGDVEAKLAAQNMFVFRITKEPGQTETHIHGDCARSHHLEKVDSWFGKVVLGIPRKSLKLNVPSSRPANTQA